MEFRDTLLAAQRNQQQKSSVESMYYKARFDPPKKEQKVKDKLSANIQKFLAKKEEEERQKKLEAQKKREELLAMRDPKALRKIQKTLKVIKSANKSVLADAIDRDNTAVTREGPDMADQDDYGYESQEAAAIYAKMMQKYSKLPDEPKFPTGKSGVAKDINGTRERVKHALQHADDPVPHKRKRRGKDDEPDPREPSPPPISEPEKKKEEKQKIRRPAPPPMDFNQLLKLAEQKKSEPVEIAQKKVITEPEPERPMTKKQKREYEEEMARRRRRQERMEAEKKGVRIAVKEERPTEKERKPEVTNGRIPKLSDRNTINRNETPKLQDREKERQAYDRGKTEKYQKDVQKERELQKDRDMLRLRELQKERDMHRNRELQKEKDLQRDKDAQREKDRIKYEKDKSDRLERERLDKERLERLKAERDRIDREMERLNKDREKLDKTKSKLESKSKLSSSSRDSIDLKSQNTYRIDKSSNENRNLPQKTFNKVTNGHTQKPAPKLSKEEYINSLKEKSALMKQKALLGERSPKSNGHIKLDPSKRVMDSNKGAPSKRPDERRPAQSQKSSAGPSKPVISNSFDFDKHVNSLGKNDSKQFPPRDVKRKAQLEELLRKKQKRPVVHSDSEYDSEMDDFIDDGDENMDYSTHIKEIFGYDKAKYRDFDDDDDVNMESSFARQQREEYISKKIGIMEDLEDMRMEAMEKSKKKKTRRISDDD